MQLPAIAAWAVRGWDEAAVGWWDLHSAIALVVSRQPEKLCSVWNEIGAGQGLQHAQQPLPMLLSAAACLPRMTAAAADAQRPTHERAMVTPPVPGGTRRLRHQTKLTGSAAC